MLHAIQDTVSWQDAPACECDRLRLDRRKTVFGEALRGIEVIDKIAAAARDDHDNPLEPIRMTETLKE
jgi:cyclophilin family peptidyl-prolyl cis-trans isomerase